MVENGGEEEERDSESARLSDTTSDASSHPTSEGNTDFVSNDVVTLPCGLCGICSKDLVSEPCSIQCDDFSCKRLFHPSCLGNSAPADNERWFCHDCRDTEHDQQLQDSPVEDPNCPVCSVDVGYDDQGLECDRCLCWFHADCSGVSNDEYQALSESEEEWYCIGCRAIRANKLKWGNMVGEDEIRSVIRGIYNEITTWRKNLFMLPRGKAGRTNASLKLVCE